MARETARRLRDVAGGCEHQREWRTAPRIFTDRDVFVSAVKKCARERTAVPRILDRWTKPSNDRPGSG
jgi:hypothetical protein